MLTFASRSWCSKWLTTLLRNAWSAQWMEAQEVQTLPNGFYVDRIYSSHLLHTVSVFFANSPLTGSQCYSEHSDPVVPEWFTLSVFTCMSLSKHPGAQSQAVKLFCALTNKPSSLTARKTSSHSAKMTRSLWERLCRTGGVGHFTIPSPAKGSHYWGHYTQQRRRDDTNSVLEPHRAAAERRSHLTSSFKAAELISFWAVHRNLCLHGSHCTRSLIDCISLCSGVVTAHIKCFVNECNV